MFNLGSVYDQVTFKAGLAKQTVHSCTISEESVSAILKPFGLTLDVVTDDSVVVIGIETFSLIPEKPEPWTVWTVQYSAKRQCYSLGFAKVR